MKPFVAVVVLAVLVVALPAWAQEQPTMDPKEKLSYSLGMDIARTFKQQGIEIDPEVFLRGFRAAYSGGPAALTDQEVRDTLQAFQKEMMAKQQERRKAQADTNKKASETFLAENKGKPGVVTLPSGLQYKVIKEGSGPMPKATDTVTVHYRGTLVDGTEFDSSISRGQPATFEVGGVIKGWGEALQLMKVGSKWQLFIPPQLAYGERGAGRLIGPESTLIFEVELLDIAKK